MHHQCSCRPAFLDFQPARCARCHPLPFASRFPQSPEDEDDAFKAGKRRPAVKVAAGKKPRPARDQAFTDGGMDSASDSGGVRMGVSMGASTRCSSWHGQGRQFAARVGRDTDSSTCLNSCPAGGVCLSSARAASNSAAACGRGCEFAAQSVAAAWVCKQRLLPPLWLSQTHTKLGSCSFTHGCRMPLLLPLPKLQTRICRCCSAKLLSRHEPNQPGQQPTTHGRSSACVLSAARTCCIQQLCLALHTLKCPCPLTACVAISSHDCPDLTHVYPKCTQRAAPALGCGGACIDGW